jgi:hypothetical protein
MDRKYKIRFYKNNTYQVFEIITTYGERISAYESEPKKIEINVVFEGSLADCDSYIRLKDGGYM